MNLLQKSLAITLGCLSLSAAACINDGALSFSIDNDLLVPGSRDQDYTAGLALAYSRRTLNDSSFYFDGLMQGLESLMGVPEGQALSYRVEVWAGYSYGLDNRYCVQYLLRVHSTDIGRDVADRTVRWGGVTPNKTWF